MSRTQIDSSLVPAAATANTNANICLANIQENFIDNGGMEVWQRGTSFTNPISGTYQADRWQMNNNGNTASFIISKETTITDGSPSSYKWALTSVGSTTVFGMRQSIEAAALAGRTVTVSVRVRVDSGGAGFVAINLNDVNGQTPFVAANATTLNNGTWETISVTRTLGTNVTTLNLGFNMNNTPGVCYIDNIMGTISSTPVSYVPIVAQVELARCQRFFVRAGQVNGVPEVGTVFSLGHCTSTTSAYGYIYPPVTMRIAPSVTFVSPSLMQVHNAAGGNIGVSTITSNYASPRVIQWVATVGSGLVAGNVTALETQNASAAPIDISADF